LTLLTTCGINWVSGSRSGTVLVWLEGVSLNYEKVQNEANKLLVFNRSFTTYALIWVMFAVSFPLLTTP